MLRPGRRRKSSTVSKKTNNFLSVALLQCEGRGFMRDLRKGSKGFSSQTKHLVDSRSSRRNSPGEALRDGVRSMMLQRPVPEMSEITDRQTDRHTHTHTWNTIINIINIVRKIWSYTAVAHFQETFL